MRTIKFIGKLKTISPIAVSMPKEAEIANKLKHEIRLPRNAHNTPYFPASSIRGWLRTTQLLAIENLLAKHGLPPLSVDEKYAYGNGTDTGRVIEKTAGYEVIAKNEELRKNNPFISLFGLWTIAGKLSVGNAVPDSFENVTVVLGDGVRHHPFNREQKLLSFVDDSELAYLKDILNKDALVSSETGDLKNQEASLKRELKTADSDRKKEIYAELEDASVGSKESIQRPLSGFEAFDAGLELSHRMVLKNPTDFDIQVFLWVLSKASVNLHLGGHENVGCGEVAFEWDVIELSFDNPQPTKIGTVTLNDDGFSTDLNFDGKSVEDKILDGTINLKQYT